MMLLHGGSPEVEPCPTQTERNCEGVGLVKRVHTLLGGVHRLATALKEVEEVRQEVREVKDEESGEINVEGEPHTS